LGDEFTRIRFQFRIEFQNCNILAEAHPGNPAKNVRSVAERDGAVATSTFHRRPGSWDCPPFPSGHIENPDIREEEIDSITANQYDLGAAVDGAAEPGPIRRGICGIRFHNLKWGIEFRGSDLELAGIRTGKEVKDVFDPGTAIGNGRSREAKHSNGLHHMSEFRRVFVPDDRRIERRTYDRGLFD
jgi:hypothetical protein